MKLGRIIFTVILIGLCGWGWFTQISAISANERQFSRELETANACVEQGLYQRAIESYQVALSIRADMDTQTKLLEVYKNSYKEGNITRSAYKSALEHACSLYPEQVDYWVSLAELVRDSNNYKEANKVIDRAGRAGASSERLSDLTMEIRYSYTESSYVYFQTFRAPNGYITVDNGQGWGVLSAKGDRIQDCKYLYISPYSDDRTAVFRTEESARLIDAKDVVQSILEEDFSEARAYGSGLLPVLQDGQWQYLNCETKTYLTDSYSDASAFQEGTAAVRQGETWKLIDTSGETVGEGTFSGVKLHGNGDYCYKDIMIAAEGGAWNIYDTKGSQSAEVSAKDMDVYLGSYIAYQDASGLWGFVDKKGNVTIEPQFQQARSFSGGLAAVSNGESWGFVDKTGAAAIPCQFLDAGYFSDDGICLVSKVDGQFSAIALRYPQN